MFSVHFLYSPLLLFFLVFVNLLRRFVTPKENEPKEKALSRQVFFKEILCLISLKTIFEIPSVSSFSVKIF